MNRLLHTLAAAAVLLGVTLPAHAVDYGSGQLGTWTNWGHGQTTDPAASVWLFGDSITNRCWPRLDTRLKAKGAKLAVNYWSGRPTAPTVDEVLKWIRDGKPLPQVLVMAAGANDIYNPPVVAGQVARLKAALPDSVQLVWVDVHAGRWGASYSTATQIANMRNSMWVNSQIRAVLPDSQVAAWSYQIAALPGRGVSLSYYLQDGVHPWPSKVSGHGDGCDLWAYAIMGKVGPLL